MKIVGRGRGSGKGGHTTGRGHKGQLARERVHILFSRNQNQEIPDQEITLYARWQQNKSAQTKPVVLSLETFSNGQSQLQ